MDWSGFGLDCVIDVIEEDALNRRSCTEVLAKLIAKADTDIVELEAELLVLETQLELAEHNDFTDYFDLCSKALKKEINSLDLSVCSLKNKNSHYYENDIGLQSQVNTEPVKKIHEILQAVLSNRFYDKDEQDGPQADTTVEEDGTLNYLASQVNHEQNLNMISSSPMETEVAVIFEIEHGSDSLGHPVNQTNREETLYVIGSSPMETEEVKFSPKDDDMLVSSSEFEKTICNLSEKVKCQEAGVADTTNADTLKCPTESEQVEVQEARLPAIHSVICSKSSFKLQRWTAKEMIQIDVQKAGATNPENLKSSSAWKGGKKRKIVAKLEQVEVQDPQTTATCKVNSLKPSLKLQKRRSRDKMKQETIQVQEPELQRKSELVDIQKPRSPPLQSPKIEEIEVSGGRQSYFMLHGKIGNNVTQWARLEVQEPTIHASDKVVDSKMGSKEKVGEDAIQLETIQSSSKGSKKRNQPKEFSREAVDSKKGKRKQQPNQVYVPNNSRNSLSSMKYTKEVVLCSSQGTIDHFPLDSVYKSYNAVELKEASRNEMPGALTGPHELRLLTLPELRSVAKLRGVKGFSKLSKEKLVQLLTTAT